MCHSRDNGNPVFLSGSRIKCGMTKNVSFPRKRESSLFVWIPDQVGDDKGGFRLRMTRGMSFPLEAKLSKRVIPVKTGIQKGLDPQSEAL